MLTLKDKFFLVSPLITFLGAAILSHLLPSTPPGVYYLLGFFGAAMYVSVK